MPGHGQVGYRMYGLPARVETHRTGTSWYRYRGTTGSKSLSQRYVKWLLDIHCKTLYVNRRGLVGP